MGLFRNEPSNKKIKNKKKLKNSRFFPVLFIICKFNWNQTSIMKVEQNELFLQIFQKFLEVCTFLEVSGNFENLRKAEVLKIKQNFFSKNSWMVDKLSVVSSDWTSEESIIQKYNWIFEKYQNDTKCVISANITFVFNFNIKKVKN